MKVKDAVCGMMIESTEAAATSHYQGRTFYFCSAECKATFDRAPEKYAGKA